MKAKIIFIEVEESRLCKVTRTGEIVNELLDYPIKKNQLFKPIKPVLVGEGEIKEGDSLFFNFKGIISHKCMEVVIDKDHPYKVQHPVRGDEVMYLPKSTPKLITQDTEDLYEQIASGELVEGKWYEFIENILTGGLREIARPLRLSNNWDVKPSHPEPSAPPQDTSAPVIAPANEVTEEEVIQGIHIKGVITRLDQNETTFKEMDDKFDSILEHMESIGVCFGGGYKPIVDEDEDTEPNEVTEKAGPMTRTKEQTEAIITALTKLSEKFYADMDKIVNGGDIYEPQEVTEEEIEEAAAKVGVKSHDYDILSEGMESGFILGAEWAIERMNKPPQDSTSQESIDYWKNYYNN